MHQNVYTSDVSSLLHVYACQGCHQQGVHSVANITPSNKLDHFEGVNISYWVDSIMMAPLTCLKM